MTSLHLLFLLSLILLSISTYYQFFHQRRPGDPSAVSKEFFETTPARQLVPRFGPLVNSGDHMIVVSAEGAYPENEPGGHLWLSAVAHWLDQGLRVTYLIVGGRNDICVSISELAVNHPEQFKIRFFPASLVDNEDARKIAESFFVTHPVFLRDNEENNKAFWLERFHFPESSMAMNVSYVAPEDVSTSSLVSKFSGRIDLLLSLSDEAPVEDLKSIAVQSKSIAA